MRRKALLTVMLCGVLAVASDSIARSNINTTYAAERARTVQGDTERVIKTGDDGTDTPAARQAASPAAEAQQPEIPAARAADEAPQADPLSAEAPQASAPSTEAPQTSAPSTEAPQTSAPSTEAPQTSAPSTEAPQTNAPSTEAPQTGPSAAEPSQTDPSAAETQPPAQTEPLSPEPPVQTQPMDPADPPHQSETGGETQPAESEPGDTEPTEGPVPETESESEPESESDSESESESESEEEKLSNEELIARQKIVIPPEIEKEFRFTQVEPLYAVVKNREGAFLYEEKSTDAREVGELSYYGSCCILEDKKDGWYYAESGNVRGFIEADQVAAGEVADRIVKIRGLEELPQARLLVARSENAAFAYTHTTAQEVLAAKEYALAAGKVNIYEQKNDSSRVTGRLADQALCFILADSEKEWVFVESGDARGFVRSEQLTVGKKVSQRIAESGETSFSQAELLIKPEENKACYYTLTSVKEAAQAARTRESMVSFAKQFLGNPYVWGGTSLTQGADCSGFVQSIYAYFGYSLPRVAEDQAVFGMQIPISSAEPGDLIFYARNGYVYHVSMYIGDEQVIHAAGRKTGIIISGIGSSAVWATRIIQD